MMPLTSPVCRRVFQKWWSKSATIEILFGGSTSVLTMNDVIIDARVAEEQRHMEHWTNEEEDRRPDQAAIEIDNDEDYNV